MKTPLSCFIALFVTAFGYGATNPVSTPPPLSAKEVAQGYREHVIIARPHAAHRGTVDSAEAAEHVHVREKFARFGDLRIIDLEETDSADAALERLRATGRYEFVEPDYLRYVQAIPNDPRYADGSLWAFNNTGQSGNVGGVAGADIKAPAAWDIIHDAPNVIVAVVDTGINLSHQDITANLWTGTNGEHGANFVGGRGAQVSTNPTDDDGHGTHVAGTIGAVGNNGLAVAGVAWRVQLMAVKVFPANAAGSVSEIAAGVNYAISKGAHIINASYGGQSNTGFSQTELAAITAAKNAGVIFVAAAGNETANMDISRFYPASHALDNIVSVGCSNRRDELSSFSNFGAAVDLFAPGEEIVSLNYASNTGTVSLSGTSMAAPHVSGALALLKAKFPSDSYRQLINRLLRGVDRGDRFIGKTQSGGRLNLLRALSATTNRPFNDDFADRPHFNTDNLAIRASNTGASAESSEPAIAGSAASATLWWEWTAPASGTVSVDTSGSAYDTVLSVFTGTSLGALTNVASNDNDLGGITSRLTFNAQAGTTYQIAVDGKGGATGLTLLNLGTTPANDAFANPVTLTGQSTSVTATNAHCSRESGEPRILGNNGGTSLWYKWTAPRSGRFQVSATSKDFDPMMAVYTGSSLSALSLVSASDNTGSDNAQTASLCTIEATAGAAYMITVDSKSASSVGEFTLSIVDSVWQYTTANSVTGTPAVASDGTVYVGGTDRSVYAFTSDGTQKWSYATGGSIDTCSPAIAGDGTVYVGANDGKLYAFNPDGTRKWTRDFANGSTSIGAGCSPAIATDGTIYIRVTDGFLYAINPGDGSIRWKSSVNATTASFYGNPVIGPDGTIYQGSDETDKALYAFNPDGTSKWSLGLDSGVYGAPAIDASGNLYLTCLTGSVYSLTPTKSQRWKVTSGGNISSGVALSADGGTLYYAGYDSKLYARDTATGAVRWTYTLGAEVRASSPAVDANGVVYIGCYDKKLYAINSNGTLNRTYEMGDILRSAPVLGGSRLYVGSNDQKVYAFDLTAGPSASSPWAQYRANARHLGRAANETLAITAQPTSQEALIGYPLTLSVVATGQGTLSYQWKKDGVAISGATTASYTISSVSSASAGSYTVSVTGTQGTVTSNAATITVTTAVPGRLTNVSVRTTAGTGAQTLIVGFVVSGSSNKPLLVRAVGPALTQFGVGDALADPQLTLRNRAGTVIISNNDWSDSALPGATSSVQGFPLTAGSKDAAVLTTIPANGYTVEITSANSATGTALAEVYDLDPLAGQVPSSRLINVSARAQVGTGGNILIAGFSISGNAPKQMLIRGIGPALTNYGVTGVLANPKLEIYNSNNVVVKSNDDWGGDDTVQTAFVTVQAFTLSTTSKDAALLVTLPAGSYTAQVSGVNNTTGVALIEVYEMP